MFKRTTLFLFVSFLLASSLFAQTTTVWKLTLAPYGVSPRDVAKSTTDIYDFASTGLSNVGVGSKVYLIAQLASPGIPKAKFASTTSAVWSFTFRPPGSAASFGATKDNKNDSTRIAFFTADKEGLYKIKVTEGGYSQEIIMNAAKYLGYQNPASSGLACATCHNNTSDPIVTNWGGTGHATMFTRAMNGTPGLSGPTDHYSASCIGCHVTGYDKNPTAINNGFDDLTFTYPTVLGAGGYDKLVAAFPDAMKRANIQCESCHGPASAHSGVQTDARIEATFNPAVCAYCHDSGTYHIFPAQYKSSLHANPVDESDRATCVPCHTGKGFAQVTSGMTTADPYFDLSYSPISCQACHDPHSAAKINQLRTVTVSLLGPNATKVPIVAGKGALCMNCHQSRTEANAALTASISVRFGPHYGPQGDILFGRNMLEVGGVKLSTSGHYWVEDACVKCHMHVNASPTNPDGSIVEMGGHSFGMSSYKKEANGDYQIDPVTKRRIVEKNNMEACAPCHGSTFGSFKNVGFYMNGTGDFDNDGTGEGLQLEVWGMVNKIMTELGKIPGSTFSAEYGQFADGKFYAFPVPKTAWTKTQLSAYWNAITAHNDKSGGIHNPKYVVSALRGAMGSLGIPTGVEKEEAIPIAYTLYQNYPNPFNPTTNIKFALPASGHVKLTIYDAVGREVSTLVNNELSAGTHNIEWKANNMASGVYLYRIEAGNYVKVNKMLLVK